MHPRSALIKYVIIIIIIIVQHTIYRAKANFLSPGPPYVTLGKININK